jgi:hypothetical protein
MDLPMAGKCLDYDGNLANPLELTAMGLWLVVLLVVLLPAASAIARRWRLRLPAGWALAIALLLVFPSVAARVLISTLICRLVDPEVMSVGFFGGVSPFLVPVLAAAAWLVVYHRVSTRIAMPTTTRSS